MTAPARLDVFAPITKRERDPKTGHLYVYGKITGPDLDRDQQRMDTEWLKAAVPEWFTRGNIREGHDHRRAVGKAVDLEEKSDGWYIGAKIVDRDAIEKVEEEVLTGFSIGIKGPRLDHTKADAPNGTIVSGRICETSLVDVPCLGSATISEHWEIPLAKSDAAGDLQPVEQPELIRVEGDSRPTGAYGLPAELYDRLATPVKEALATLAAGGATVTAEAAKADSADERVPVVVNVSVHAPETVTADPDFVDTFTNPAMIGTDPSGGLGKADTSAAGRRSAASSGAAMSDGSYPIKTKADLRKAIKAVGRGNADHSAIRKHIMKRAKALGLEAMVPTNWNADGSLKGADKADADEELVAKAEQILRDVRALAPSLTKADDGNGTDSGEGGDIASADQAIAVIARLIISEAESLAQGNLNEACDISILLDAVRSLKWFKEAEQYEEQTMTAAKSDSPTETAETTEADPAAAAETADASTAEAATTETSAPAEGQQTTDEGQQADDGDTHTSDTDGAPTDAAESDAVTKAVVAELVKAAVAEVTTASEERTKTLEAELAKAQQAIEEFRAMPAPGGPALTRTAAQQTQAKNSDADRMRQEAQTLMAKADQVSDRDLRDGYRDRAKALLAKAEA
jgi:hypothetical protein